MWDVFGRGAIGVASPTRLIAVRLNSRYVGNYVELTVWGRQG